MITAPQFLLLFVAYLGLFVSDAGAGEKFPAAKFDEVRAFVYNVNSATDFSEPFLQKEGRLHASNSSGEGIKLNEKQTEKLIAALNAEHETLGAMCFMPHHAFVFYKAGKPVASTEICFLCGNGKSRPRATPKIDFGALIGLVRQLDLPYFTSLDEWDLFNWTVEQDPEKSLLLEEDFETAGTLIHQKLVDKSQITHLPKGGKDGSAGIRVAYEGSARGSDRVLARFPLRRAVTNATLSFDVFFESDFQFVKGGKLHGLGPTKPATGGKKPGPKDWSARIMFGPKGAARTYNYHQQLKGTYGEGTTSETPCFKPNTWHQVSYYIHLNDPDYKSGSFFVPGDGFFEAAKPEEKEEEAREEPEKTGDGRAFLFIDGHLINPHAPELLFREKDGPNSLIQHLLFSTFHGGHDSSWAPKNKDKSYATVYARFDNFSVHEGAFIRHPFKLTKLDE